MLITPYSQNFLLYVLPRFDRLKEEKKGLEGQQHVDQIEPLNSSEEDGDSQKDG